MVDYDGDYDGDYDFRTWNEKYRDDNTWQKDRGVLKFDGVPFLMCCKECLKVVQVRKIEGSTVWDRYSYTVCNECGAHENRMRDLTEEEKDQVEDYEGF